MKLKELAQIFRGVKFSKEELEKVKPISGNYYQYWTENSLANKEGIHYISAKKIRKNKLEIKQISLIYGDYLVYRKDKKFKFFRYSEVEKVIPANDIYIIRTEHGIISNFLGYEKNRNYLFTCLKKMQENKNGLNLINALGEVEILTDNILELEEANKAEEYGIRKPLSKGDLPIKMRQKPITLDKLLKRIEYKELLIDSEFQRRPNLWDSAIKSRFIESLIARVPVPAFYFDGANDDEWLIIDGLQRLSTIKAYVDNEFELTELDFLTELHGKKFEDLERAYRRSIEEYEVFAYILEKGNSQSVKYKIFKNINTSALKLEGQEIRHAITPGFPATFLKEIVETIWFQACVPISDYRKSRMYDREVVLRYLVFQEKNYKLYSPNIVDYLDDGMTNLYNVPQYQFNNYKQIFKETSTFLKAIFGEACFSRNSMENNKQGYSHNNIIFELLTYGFSKIDEKCKLKLMRNKKALKNKIIFFFKKQSEENKRFWNYDYAYSKAGLQQRFSNMDKFISEIKKNNQ